MKAEGFRSLWCLSCAAALLVWAAEAYSQAYPSRTVRIVAPFAPGGAADVPVRILAPRLAEGLGQQVVIDNRPGVGGTIGADVVAKAAPDGYTLLVMASTHLISAAVHAKLPYDVLTDFVPISEFANAPNVLVVHPSLPAKSVRELVALAKAQPGKIDFASSGTGGSQHLFGVLFMSLTGTKFTHIPYKGSNIAAADVVAGHVPVSFPGIAVVLAHVRAGKLRALGVTSARRSLAMPDVPSIAEAGVRGYDATLWLGLAAPKNTPREIIARLHRETVSALKLPEVRGAFAKSGTEVGFQATPEAFDAYVKSEAMKWGGLVRASGVKAD
jgi:tripartite-type tricarboxylate transporter receptor subunit TctC